ncbi:hypothetical protein [Kluyvera genomosp. 3]|uniref:Lipoprotein n=1 Tax=Kluyvera genomosp. 3 TaxID=2774055 RepID=A0A6G9RP45_9ENTR|nr:hypothetical protein [Kluyvera genomosp. 3]QIR27729.1 hypothetical protein GY169_13355 [Kluyvera genomosp. 3]
MKRLIIIACVLSTLTGCATELQDEAAESSNEKIMQFVTEWQPACGDSNMLYEPNHKEMIYRENMGRMNAQEDAQQIQQAAYVCGQQKIAKAQQEAAESAYKSQQIDQNNQLERECEAMHPLMVSQCAQNAAVNNLIDSL